MSRNFSQEHFSNGDVEGLFCTLENRLEALIQGPELKNQATYDYEYIIKMMLLNKKFSFSVDDDGYFVEVEGEKFNITEILSKFNPRHMALDEAYHILYVDYLKNRSAQKPKKKLIHTRMAKDTWPTEQYFNEVDTNRELEDLSYAEKCAINIYTQDYYKTLNNMLRGEMAIEPKTPSFQRDMEEVLLHGGFASFGLNKVKSENVQYAFRVDKKLPEGVLDKKIKSIQSGSDVYIERGFVSTSKEKPVHRANFVL